MTSELSPPGENQNWKGKRKNRSKKKQEQIFRKESHAQQNKNEKNVVF